MLKEVIQKAIIPAVHIHIKTAGLFRNRAKSRTLASSESQAYSSICQKPAKECFIELMQIDCCTVLKYDKWRASWDHPG